MMGFLSHLYDNLGSRTGNAATAGDESATLEASAGENMDNGIDLTQSDDDTTKGKMRQRQSAVVRAAKATVLPTFPSVAIRRTRLIVW